MDKELIILSILFLLYSPLNQGLKHEYKKGGIKIYDRFYSTVH